MSVQKVSMKIGGNDLVLETGRIAKQANGAVFATYAGCAVIATVCCGAAPTEPLDYVPLSVEYNERYYAAGKIPGGFMKRIWSGRVRRRSSGSKEAPSASIPTVT